MAPAVASRRSGQWRSIVLTGTLALAFAPAYPLLLSAFAPGEADSSTNAFFSALLLGMSTAAAAAAVSFLLGLPTGLVLALHEFPLRRFLILSVIVALLLPSFLVALGLSMLSGAVSFGGAIGSRVIDLSAWIGTVWSLASLGVALVTFVTYAAAGNITGSQVAAVRLAGGESAVLRQAMRAVWPVSALAAAFAGILALADAGPGLVFGHHGAAAEILISFSAQYDFQQAARQCLLLSGAVAVLALPCAAKLAPLLAKAMLARDLSAARAARTSWRKLEALGALALVLLILGLPLLGLLLPLAHDFPIVRALADTARTAGYTIVYALSASAVAIVLGFVLALAAGRSERLRALLVTGLLVLIALPPAFTALGWVQLATRAPEELDGMMRGGPLLALHLGLRSLPIATLFALRAINTASPSWSAAAALHGIRPGIYLRKILIPWAAPALWTAAGAIALLAMADITSALLLHPPGRGTIALTLFSVMANAPEAYVATLCLVYVTGAMSVVALGFGMRQKWR